MHSIRCFFLFPDPKIGRGSLAPPQSASVGLAGWGGGGGGLRIGHLYYYTPLPLNLANNTTTSNKQQALLLSVDTPFLCAQQSTQFLLLLDHSGPFRQPNAPRTIGQIQLCNIELSSSSKQDRIPELFNLWQLEAARLPCIALILLRATEDECTFLTRFGSNLRLSTRHAHPITLTEGSIAH